MRLASLDVLRCIAVLLVIGRHAPVNGFVSGLFHNGGWVGVDLFFVLSGFLVSGLLFREYLKTGGVDVKRFLIRRGFKIYPAFWVFLIVVIILFPAESTPRNIFGEIIFMQNYVGRILSHTWSLAVEEHFYIGLAILTLFLRKRAFRDIPSFFVLVAVGCLVLRALFVFFKGINIFPTHFRIDSLFFGVLISYLWHFRGWETSAALKKYRYLLMFAGAAGLSVFFLGDILETPFVFVFGLSWAYLASGMLLLGFLQTDMKALMPLARVGVYSYSIYLWHMPVVRLLDRWELSWPIFMLLYVGGSIAIGIALSKAIEIPALRLRNKLFPSEI